MSGTAIEMQHMGEAAGCEHDDNDDTSRTPTTTISTSGRAKRNYLSMIMLAYILTIISPGTKLWLRSTSLCGQPQVVVHTPNTIIHESHETEIGGNHTFNMSYPTNQNNAQTTIAKCVYGSINTSVLAKLTCFTMLLISLFLNLQGGNPGVLTNDVMTKLDDASDNSTHATTITTNGSEFDSIDEERTLERQSFLEPLPLASSPTNIQSNTLSSLEPPPQSKHQKKKLYPHKRRKYCHKCHIHPPLRSHHCNHCNACIATFDHHCVFLDTCIGERNHFRFWLFVLLNVICLHVALGIVGSSTIHISTMFGKSSSDSGGVVRIGLVIIIISKLYMYSIYIVAILLWMIHTTLALGNTTTFEATKGPEHIDYLEGTNMMDLPFSRGLLYNVRLFFSRDDCYLWIKDGRIGEILNCCCFKANSGKNKLHKKTADNWTPILWKMPEFIDRESEDWWNHPWQNKYWSCC